MGVHASNPTDGSGSWLAANHWSNGTNDVTWTNNNNAVIGHGGAGGGINLSNKTVIVNSLTFGTVTAGYSLTNGTVSLTNATSGGTIKVTDSSQTPTMNLLGLAGSGTIVFTNGSLNINGLTNSGNLTLSGAGNWQVGVTLNGKNTNYTGLLNVSNAWLTVTNDLDFGAVPGVYKTNALTLVGGAAALENTLAATLTIATNRGITINGGAIFYNDGAGSIILNSPIIGPAGYVVYRYGNFIFNATNSYAGLTQPWAADMTIGVNNALPYGTGSDIVQFKDWDTAEFDPELERAHADSRRGEVGGHGRILC